MINVVSNAVSMFYTEILIRLFIWDRLFVYYWGTTTLKWE